MTRDVKTGYFLYHSIGQYPGKAEDMARTFSAFSESWGRCDDGQWPAALASRQAFLDRWTQLINAPAGTLTSAENVTTALYSLIRSLPKRHLAGRKLLVGADCFPSLHFLLAGLAERHGFELCTVPIRQGEYWVRDDDFIDHWDQDVGVALLTWVTSTTSHRCDHEALLAHGRSRDTLVGIDITQGAGLFPFDVQKPRVDFTVSTSLKWLCGTPGAGILHVDHALLETCSPELRGWFSQENPFSWDLDGFAYAPDARRFDHGTPSVVACVGSLAALEWHAAQDAAALLAHNRGLTDRIIAQADMLGLELVSPREESQRGGSVMVRLPETLAPAILIDTLRTEQLYADCRGRTLRLSPGVVTGQECVARLFETLGAELKKAR